MSYHVKILKRVEKQLKNLPIQTQEKIAEEIGLLGQNPNNPALDIRTLINDLEAQFRLRVGSYRIKFNKDDFIKIVSIIKIAHRRDVYR